MRIALTTGELPDRPAGVAERTAVRAVIQRGDQLLMVHSQVAGDFKFPGGGVEPGESLHGALLREVREECGRTVASIGGVVLEVEERRPGQDPGWVLQMRSVYLACEVGEVEHDLALDDYESVLGFRAGWVRPDEALRVNEGLLSDGSAHPWVAREVEVLRLLMDGRATPGPAPCG